MSPAERLIQAFVFGGLAALLWYGIIPATLGTIVHLLGLHRPRG